MQADEKTSKNFKASLVSFNLDEEYVEKVDVGVDVEVAKILH